MKTMTQRLSMIFLVCIAWASTTSAIAEDRPADKILAEINAVVIPKTPVNRNNRAAVQEYQLNRQKAAEQKAALIGELYKTHPDAPELPKLILERWQMILVPGQQSAEMKAEIEDVLARSKNEKLVAEAAFINTYIGFKKAGMDADAEKLMPIAEGFIKRAPKDDRGAIFLLAVASKVTDVAKRDNLTKRIENDYPNSPLSVKIATERRVKEAVAKLKDAVGKPFKIEFTDAIKGGQVSSETLKGKVLIIDFWATWCVPCVHEMPKMKNLYAKYKDKGVEFIGVSLDAPKSEGGYDALKAFVEKNKIEWPQFYQGNGWESEFSMSWGIQSIPAVFAVGADGNLVTTDAGGKLEELIPELLEKAEKAKKNEAKP